MVQVDIASRAASPLADEARALLERLVTVDEG
jgi:hypothetical protein